MIKSLRYKLQLNRRFKEIKNNYNQSRLIEDNNKRLEALKEIETNILDLESEIINSEQTNNVNLDKIYNLLIKIESDTKMCYLTTGRPWEPFIYGGVKRK